MNRINISSLLMVIAVTHFVVACGSSSPKRAQTTETIPAAAATSKSGVKAEEAPSASKPSELQKIPDEVKITKPEPPATQGQELPPVEHAPEKLVGKEVQAPPIKIEEKAGIPAEDLPAKIMGSTAKKNPNHFVIAIATKTSAHPFFGKGHKLGMTLDGIQGKSIALKRGEAYEFEVETDPLHDVYFSTSPAGWGGGTVTDGIKGQFTYRGLISVTPNENTPDLMYYQCRNHISMGGKVYVVNKNTNKADIDKLLANTGPVSAPSDAMTSGQQEIPVNAAKQKIMLAEMMLKSKAAVSVAEGGDETAKGMLSSATQKLQAAQQEIAGGHNNKALSLAEEALRLVSSASKSASREDVVKQQRARFNELLEALRNFQDSHKQNFERTAKKRGAAAAVDYDHVKVDALVSEGRVAADKGQFDDANQALTKAERLVTQAIHSMLDSQTIVYDLNFESPVEEYDYELKRYKSYEELVPVAIEEKKPSEAVVKLMGSYVEKGRSQKTDAENKAKGGKYPEAISMLLSATEEIRRALRLAGVSQ